MLASPRIVWLIEDHALFRETIQALLNDQPAYTCPATFGSCEAALVALTEGALPDVILCDIGLPGMSGIEGVQHIKQHAPAVPVIMLTVHQDNERIFQAICAGASGYLLKTASPEAIVQALDQVGEGGAAMDAQIARRVLSMFTQLAVPKQDYGLSDREREILEHLVGGHTNKQIAARLFLSPHTVDRHLRNIYAKLHVHNRSGAISKALREHLVR
ncbi:MAG: response regulator transcription factor [Bacteroidota bacterium]